MGQLNGSWKQ